MPGVSADSDEAALENWLVDLGATLTAGDAIASVETEKAVVDVEVDEDSIVHALLASAGDMVPVGDPIAVLLAPGEPTSAGEELVRQLTGGADPTVSPGADATVEKAGDADAGDAVTAVPAALESETVSAAPMEVGVPAPAAATSGNAAVPAVEADGKAGSPARPSSNGRLFASPLARRLAKELDVDITAVNGSGPGGRIVTTSRLQPVPRNLPNQRRHHQHPPPASLHLRPLLPSLLPPNRRFRPAARPSHTRSSASSSPPGCRRANALRRISTFHGS
jgi:pyruvate dehydrogenase E2 component (dihydrolipoamide acetyltransferase)